MAEESSQDDKTEEPTARKLEKAREDGQVLRSQDMTIAAVTISVIASMYVGGFWLGPQFVAIFADASNDSCSNYAFEEELAIRRFRSINLQQIVSM